MEEKRVTRNIVTGNRVRKIVCCGDKLWIWEELVGIRRFNYLEKGRKVDAGEGLGELEFSGEGVFDVISVENDMGNSKGMDKSELAKDPQGLLLIFYTEGTVKVINVDSPLAIPKKIFISYIPFQKIFFENDCLLIYLAGYESHISKITEEKNYTKNLVEISLKNFQIDWTLANLDDHISHITKFVRITNKVILGNNHG
jgi:hypothetical protein